MRPSPPRLDARPDRDAGARDSSPARGPTGFPNPLFDDGRAVLARFGYRCPEAGDGFEDWPEMWDKLRGDFTTKDRLSVSAFTALSSDQREAAIAYMEERLAVGRRLVAFERAHAEMLKHDIDHALVELYTAARASYEDWVMRFGAPRERLASPL